MRPVLCGLYTENIPMSARLASACAFVTIMRNSYTQTMRPRAAFFLLLLLFSLAGSAAPFSATCIHLRTFWAPRPSSSSEKSRLGRTCALSLALARFLLHAWIALTATAQDRTGESSTSSWSSSSSSSWSRSLNAILAPSRASCRTTKGGTSSGSPWGCPRASRLRSLYLS